MDYAVNSLKHICNVVWISKNLVILKFFQDVIKYTFLFIYSSGLMDKDDMGNLGFADMQKSKQEKPSRSSAKEET